MNEELLLKYITGQATEGEKIRILNWLEEHPDNRLKFNRLKNTWVISKLPETKAPGSERTTILPQNPPP